MPAAEAINVPSTSAKRALSPVLSVVSTFENEGNMKVRSVKPALYEEITESRKDSAYNVRENQLTLVENAASIDPELEQKAEALRGALQKFYRAGACAIL